MSSGSWIDKPLSRRALLAISGGVAATAVGGKLQVVQKSKSARALPNSIAPKGAEGAAAQADGTSAGDAVAENTVAENAVASDDVSTESQRSIGRIAEGSRV